MASDEGDAPFGVSSAGDVDGDGWGDLLIGGITGVWIEYGGVR